VLRCNATLLLYKVVILSANYRLLLGVTTSPRVRAAGRPVYVKMVKGPTGSDIRYLSDKIMMLYL
jgi:hypothetical protein